MAKNPMLPPRKPVDLVQSKQDKALYNAGAGRFLESI